MLHVMQWQYTKRKQTSFGLNMQLLQLRIRIPYDRWRTEVGSCLGFGCIDKIKLSGDACCMAYDTFHLNEHQLLIMASEFEN